MPDNVHAFNKKNMNTTRLKSYAPQARKDFIAAVTARAHRLGISENNGKLDLASSEKTGDIVLIAGQAWPANVHQQRERLIQKIQRDGFAHTMEAVAYTWFNRFAALRYMELHDYLDHGHRVLSSREGGLPEILGHASDLVEMLPGLNAAQIADLKLAGDKDGELYRLLLVAQCNALSSAMPFLFERIDDESELLLPDNLIRTDSLIRSMVEEIPEADWVEIEIIGWLYQFYISERKDQVIGGVVASEDIPSATQLFTPNWIVKYMVQNSLGAQWLATYPDSPLKGQMTYYIEPAEQTAEVTSQLAAITPSDLNPEELTLIDPACGSGHILVEAYELFKEIYLERGYRQRDVAQLILEKNLYGLDIDERASQLTGFALMMKGRADDRRLFERGVKLNVMALVDSEEFDAAALAQEAKLADYGLMMSDLTEVKRIFECASTFGSLIRLPVELAAKLPALKQLSKAISQDLFVSDALERLGRLVLQAELLTLQYDAVVANPPYMGSGGMNALLRGFTVKSYPQAKSDLFACFIVRGFELAKTTGDMAMVAMQGWMFSSSFKEMREWLLVTKTIRTLTQIGFNSFPSLNSKIALAAVFSAANRKVPGYTGTFIDLNSAPQSADKKEVFLAREQDNLFTVVQDNFNKIPSSPLAYWATRRVLDCFTQMPPLAASCKPVVGLQTGDNDRFIRNWTEVAIHRIGFNCASAAEASTSKYKWFPYTKGGGFRKWYGNNTNVLNWSDDGAEIKGCSSSVIRNSNYYFRSGLAYTNIGIQFGARATPSGYIFDQKGSMFFPVSDESTAVYLAFLSSKVVQLFLRILCPSLDFNPGSLSLIPFDGCTIYAETLARHAQRLIDIGKRDWDSYERSWDFQYPSILAANPEASSLESSYALWLAQSRENVAEMKRLEEECNRLFIEAFGLSKELTPDVPLSQVTLTVNPVYRYGSDLTEEEQWTRFRKDTMKELVSYVIGCMMGRYSRDESGLIYAHAGNLGFDATRYKSFPADADGIVPVTDELWFEDDAALRLREFLRVTWDSEKLDQNLSFLAVNLGVKGTETPGETVRRYLANQFFKDHLQTYKKRPIYWLFSSGKQGAFQALVYLHRYHEGTLARMRAEYVVPLTGKMQSRIEMLEKDRDAASSTTARNKIAKQIESLKKKHVELLSYDEKLRHYADMRIQLNLDDSVTVNYGKFGDLLAEVKAVTGGSGDE